ncbi:hypothetical protein [Rhodonellum ikkaensis]|nr:hypothetical protein [Rhodonellum ikkaensis]
MEEILTGDFNPRSLGNVHPPRIPLGWDKYLLQILEKIFVIKIDIILF